MNNLKKARIVDAEREPEHRPDWEPDHTLYDHLPADMAWLDRMQAEYKASLMARRITQTVPELSVGLYWVKGGRAGKSRSAAQLELMPKPVAKRYGLRAIIRIANELEFALNYFQRESDVEMLIAAEPHLRRVDRVVRQMTRAAAKARLKNSPDYSLFDE